MFAGTYFPPRYFPSRYWVEVGADPVIPDPVHAIFRSDASPDGADVFRLDLAAGRPDTFRILASGSGNIFGRSRVPPAVDTPPGGGTGNPDLLWDDAPGVFDDMGGTFDNPIVP